MLPIVDFFLKNIYCSSKQDRQFSFALHKVNHLPVKTQSSVYNTTKRLPDATSPFDVYVIGNFHPGLLNLLSQDKDWYTDVWVNLSEDMTLRNYIAHVYDTKGLMRLRSDIYYSFIDQGSIIFAVKRKSGVHSNAQPDTSLYFHIYSTAYFNTPQYTSLSVAIGVDYVSAVVYNNVDKVTLQEWVTQREDQGGKCFIYVNGLYHDKVTLDIPNASLVEIVYDQSVVSKIYVPMQELRQFTSTKFNDTRYLLMRERVLDEIEYYDDAEVYITTQTQGNNQGLFYYRHTSDAMYMATDKDYTFNASYVNALATELSTLKGGAAQDKQVVLYTRRSGVSRPLVYSDLRLHELYKLPDATLLNTLNGTGESVLDLRVETLENSPYFRIAAEPNPFAVSKDNYMQALGYNAVSYYFGYNTVAREIDLNVQVPELYQEVSTAYEYDAQGRLMGHYVTVGPVYSCSSSDVSRVEFIKGTTPVCFNAYYEHNDTVTLAYSDYVVLSALFTDDTRVTEWVNITDDITKVQRGVNNELTLTGATGERVAVVYLNEPNIYDVDLDLSQGAMSLPLMHYRFVNGQSVHIPLEIAYSNVELFLNGYRLIEGLDYGMDYPQVSICNKSYINYALPTQKLHVRCHGYTHSTVNINAQETAGWVNNGALSRNSVFDIRDDRVMSVYISGMLYPREVLHYAEEDNVVRTSDSLNGRPYVMSEPMISLKQVTGLDTLPWYTQAKDKDARLKDFFTRVTPQPAIDTFNVVGQKHNLFSPTLSAMVVDLLEGVIPVEVYTTPYSDSTIVELLDTRYATLLKLDPVKKGLPVDLVNIHPHLGNTVINLNLHQYRFMTNAARLIAGTQVTLSGYFGLTT